MRTGYAPNPTVRHPSLGSIVAQQLGKADFDLPNFVKLRGSPFPAGYVGVENNPFVISRPGARIDNLDYAKGVDKDRMERRMKLVREMEKDFAKRRGEEAVEAHEAMYDKARRLMDSDLRKKFYLDDEPEETRKAYGAGQFADSLIIARRLVEAGVPAVEVVQGGWDTHDDNFNRVANLCKQIDQPWAALIDDLKKRGLYDSTLVVWMGEFGRTPRITATEGRDHWPNNFCVVLGGGGVNAGTVIGETDEEGVNRDSKGNNTLKDPVNPADLYKTIGTMMDWELNKEFHAGSRPMWLAEKAAQPIEKIFK
jgi:arylsulfatase A-like enzyme